MDIPTSMVNCLSSWSEKLRELAFTASQFHQSLSEINGVICINRGDSDQVIKDW